MTRNVNLNMGLIGADTKSQCMQEQAFEWVQFPHYYNILQMRTQVYRPLQLLVKGNRQWCRWGGGGGGGCTMWVHKHPVNALVQPCIIVVFIVIIDTWLLTHSQYNM